jgi:hypothetical protein
LPRVWHKCPHPRDGLCLWPRVWQQP